jgi:hypothetical protein
MVENAVGACKRAGADGTAWMTGTSPVMTASMWPSLRRLGRNRAVVVLDVLGVATLSDTLYVMAGLVPAIHAEGQGKR